MKTTSPDDKSVNERVLRELAAQVPDGADLQIPPPIFDDMDAKMLDYEEGRALTVRLPVKERYQNPMGLMQGGMVVAAIDNTLGPLSYLAAPPSVTTELSTSFLRPVTPGTDCIDVRGEVVERHRRQLLLRAEVRLPSGDLAATAHARCVVVTRGE